MKERKFKVSFLTLAMMLVFVIAMNITSFAASPAPTGLRQTYASTSSIKVTWDAVIGSVGYNVYYSSDNVNFIRTSTSEYYDTYSAEEYISGLSAGKTYYVKVCAVQKVGNSYPYSYVEGVTCASIDVVTAPDTTNAKLVQTGATTSSYTLKLTGAIGANYYYAYDDNDITLATSSTNTLKVTKRPAGKKEWIHVKACRKSTKGFIAEGSYEYERVGTLTKKASTKDFGITSAYENINVYYFSIISSADFDGWQIQFSRPNSKKSKTFTESGTGRCRISDFINGSYYRYRVRTYLEVNGKKAYSNWSDYNTVAIPKKITAKTSRSKRQLSLNWSAVSGASQYAVYVSDKENSGYKKVGTVKSRSITIKKYGKKSLSKGKKYYVRIVPIAKIGNKNVSAKVYEYVSVTL